MVQDKDSSKAAGRMADLHDTIEKLVAVAKKKGYIDSACTVESLKAEAVKSREKETQDDAVSLMTAMKKNLDVQTTAVRLLNHFHLSMGPRAHAPTTLVHFSCTALQCSCISIAASSQAEALRVGLWTCCHAWSHVQVTEFMKDRVNHDAEWEEAAWAKLLNSNQDILVLMSRLHERGLITQDMINMATLPDKPPPSREQDMHGVAPSTMEPQSFVPPGMDGSMMGSGMQPMYGGHSSMMGGAHPDSAPVAFEPMFLLVLNTILVESGQCGGHCWLSSVRHVTS